VMGSPDEVGGASGELDNSKVNGNSLRLQFVLFRVMGRCLAAHRGSIRSRGYWKLHLRLGKGRWFHGFQRR
jgi:hypothetical protein